MCYGIQGLLMFILALLFPSTQTVFSYTQQNHNGLKLELHSIGRLVYHEKSVKFIFWNTNQGRNIYDKAKIFPGRTRFSFTNSQLFLKYSIEKLKL